MARSDWRHAKIGQFATPIRRPVVVEPDKQYRTMGVKWWGLGAYERETKPGHEIKATKMFAVKPGDLIINKIWARHGSSGIVGDELDGCFVTTDFPTFEIDTSQVERRWLAYLFRTETFWKDCEAKSRGTSGRQRIDPKEYLEIEIPLPPLAEQQRIVARIDALAARIAEAQKLQAEATEEAEGFFEATVNAVFAEVKQTNHQPLAELTSRIGSGSTPKGGREVYLESGIPFIRSLNVRMRQFKLDNLVYIDEATHQAMRRTWVEPNDVLLNITGASIGRVACVPIEFQTANVSQHVAIIRPLPELDSRYLMYCLSQPMVQDLINHQQKGATRQGFTKAQIEQLQIPVPPLNEQRRIVAYLDRVQVSIITRSTPGVVTHTVPG
jgi:type I restriction enzyme S subunit